MNTLTRIPDQIIERVPAHDLVVGDTVIVDALSGDYIAPITEIVEYAVFTPLTGERKYGHSEANSRCLCIRLPKLNIYRANFDMVRRVTTAPA